MNKSEKKIKMLKAKKRKRKRIIRITILLFIFLIIIITPLYLRKSYIYNKCENLEFSVDYHFTNYHDKDLRLSNVKTMFLLEEDENKAIVEAYGFTYKEPKYRAYRVGEFIKDKNNTWIISNIYEKVEKTDSTDTPDN